MSLKEAPPEVYKLIVERRSKGFQVVIEAEKLKPPPRIITISGRIGTGKTSVARQVANRLHWKHERRQSDYYRKKLSKRELARKGQLVSVEEDRQIDMQVRQSMKASKERVYEGRSTGKLASKMDALRVLLVASEEVRFKRASKEERGEERETRASFEARDWQDYQRYGHELYPETNVYSVYESYYDIVIFNDGLTIEDQARVIMGAALERPVPQGETWYIESREDINRVLGREPQPNGSLRAA